MGLNQAVISAEQIQAERDGVWRLVPGTIADDMTAVEFKVRLWESSGAQEEFMKLLQRNPSLAAGKSNDAQKYKTICQRKALVHKCLDGWRTVRVERTDDESDPYRRVEVIKEDEIELAGTWVAYSQRASEVLLGMKYRNVYDALQVAAHDDEAYAEYLNGEGGVLPNSETSSSGNSSTSGSSSHTSETS